MRLGLKKIGDHRTALRVKGAEKINELIMGRTGVIAWPLGVISVLIKCRL